MRVLPSLKAILFEANTQPETIRQFYEWLLENDVKVNILSLIPYVISDEAESWPFSLTVTYEEVTDEQKELIDANFPRSKPAILQLIEKQPEEKEE